MKEQSLSSSLPPPCFSVSFTHLFFTNWLHPCPSLFISLFLCPPSLPDFTPSISKSRTLTWAHVLLMVFHIQLLLGTWSLSPSLAMLALLFMAKDKRDVLAHVKQEGVWGTYCLAAMLYLLDEHWASPHGQRRHLCFLAGCHHLHNCEVPPLTTLRWYWFHFVIFDFWRVAVPCMISQPSCCPSFLLAHVHCCRLT